MNNQTIGALLLLALLALCGCPQGSSPPTDQNGSSDSGNATSESEQPKLKVVATTSMIGDTVARIGGEHIELTTLMGPGVDPHLYQPKASDLQALSDADVIFYNGLHLEAKMGDVLEKMSGSRKVVAVAELTDEAKLLASENYADQHDPHIWMDPSLWLYAIAGVKSTFIEVRPDLADSFRTNADGLYTEVTEAAVAIENLLATVPEENRVLVTAHDAFGYFGKRYGYEVRGLQGISTEAEAGAGDVRDLVDFVVDNKIPAIFIESSVPERNINAVIEGCRAKGHSVKLGGELYSDALGPAGSGADTYIGMLKHNAETIASALGGESPGGKVNVPSASN